MTSFIDTVRRELACGAAAALITSAMSLAFVQSTSVPPGTHVDGRHIVALQPQHAWFGQPEPAVLVD